MLPRLSIAFACLLLIATPGAAQDVPWQARVVALIGDLLPPGAELSTGRLALRSDGGGTIADVRIGFPAAAPGTPRVGSLPDLQEIRIGRLGVAGLIDGPAGAARVRQLELSDYAARHADGVTVTVGRLAFADIDLREALSLALFVRGDAAPDDSGPLLVENLAIDDPGKAVRVTLARAGTAATRGGEALDTRLEGLTVATGDADLTVASIVMPVIELAASPLLLSADRTLELPALVGVLGDSVPEAQLRDLALVGRAPEPVTAQIGIVAWRLPAVAAGAARPLELDVERLLIDAADLPLEMPPAGPPGALELALRLRGSFDPALRQLTADPVKLMVERVAEIDLGGSLGPLPPAEQLAAADPEELGRLLALTPLHAAELRLAERGGLADWLARLAAEQGMSQDQLAALVAGTAGELLAGGGPEAHRARLLAAVEGFIRRPGILQVRFAPASPLPPALLAAIAAVRPGAILQDTAASYTPPGG